MTDDVREALALAIRKGSGASKYQSELLAGQMLSHLAFEFHPRGTVPAKQISDADTLRFGKVAWIAYQDDKEWAKSVVEDCFSPADDLPEEALNMITVARAVLEAAQENQ